MSRILVLMITVASLGLVPVSAFHVYATENETEDDIFYEADEIGDLEAILAEPKKTDNRVNKTEVNDSENRTEDDVIDGSSAAARGNKSDSSLKADENVTSERTTENYAIKDLNNADSGSQVTDTSKSNAETGKVADKEEIHKNNGSKAAIFIVIASVLLGGISYAWKKKFLFFQKH